MLLQVLGKRQSEARSEVRAGGVEGNPLPHRTASVAPARREGAPVTRLRGVAHGGKDGRLPRSQPC